MYEVVHGRRNFLKPRYDVTESRYKLYKIIVLLYAQLLFTTVQVKYQSVG
jgi:hypothetical protein